MAVKINTVVFCIMTLVSSAVNFHISSVHHFGFGAAGASIFRGSSADGGSRFLQNVNCLLNHNVLFQKTTILKVSLLMQSHVYN
jgi:hypothetical protein